MTNCWTFKLELPLSEAENRKWRRYPIHKGKTRILDFISCHASVLSPKCSPHSPHSHAEEEILMVLDGEAELRIYDDRSTDSATIRRLFPGSLVHYPAWNRHTIFNPGNSPVTYLMFKWLKQASIKDDRVSHRVFDYGESFPQAEKSFSARKLFEYQSSYLDKLHCHLSTVKPGGGYREHVDKHDVAIVTLEGKVSTLERLIEPRSVIFYPAGEKHGMRNDFGEEARYLVFEFHAPRRRIFQQFMSRGMKRAVAKMNAAMIRMKMQHDRITRTGKP